MTRLKSNVKTQVVQRSSVLNNKGPTSDQTIEFTEIHTARTIANIYKVRWRMELFFKWIKQNLKIKSFLSTSRNVVLTQIWIAFCVYLLLAFIKF